MTKTNRLNPLLPSRNVARTSDPTPSRFQIARKRRGLTKTALARRCGLTSRTLYDYEAGRGRPSEEAIEAIAEALRFPVSFFCRAEIDEPSPGSASFRALSSMTAGQRDAALAAGALAFELSEWIDERFELPEPRLPDLRDMKPHAAAMAIRDYWDIGERPVGNMIHLLECHGTRVFSLAEHGKQVDAFSLWHKGMPFVFLNTMKTAEHSRMDAAHELGHLLLHRHGTPTGRNIEPEANSFGAAFLMPEGSVLARTSYLMTPTLNQLVQLKKTWKVSASALARRLHELRLLSDWNYRRLCIELSKLGRTREPEGIASEASQVFARVFSDLRKSGTTKTEVARQLDWQTEDLESLVFGLTITSTGRQTTSVDAARSRHLFRVV